MSEILRTIAQSLAQAGYGVLQHNYSNTVEVIDLDTDLRCTIHLKLSAVHKANPSVKDITFNGDQSVIDLVNDFIKNN